MTCLSSNRTHSHALYPKKKYSKLDTLAPNVPPLFLITPACRDCVHDGSPGFQVLSTRPSQAAMNTNNSQRASRARMDMRSCSGRSEEHTSELQSRGHLVCRLLLEKKKMADDRARRRSMVRCATLALC